MKARGFAVLAALVLGACEGAGAPGTPVALRAVEPRLSAAGVGALVTGNAIYQFDATARKAAFSFQARVMPNGQVQGEWVNFDQAVGGMRSRGDITCLTVDDAGHARLVGRILETADTAGLAVGEELFWRIVDTGPGTQAPDSSTILITSRKNNSRLWFVQHLCSLPVAQYEPLVHVFLYGGTYPGAPGPFPGVPRDPVTHEPVASWVGAFQPNALDFGNLTIH